MATKKRLKKTYTGTKDGSKLHKRYADGFYDPNDDTDKEDARARKRFAEIMEKRASSTASTVAKPPPPPPPPPTTTKKATIDLSSWKPLGALAPAPATTPVVAAKPQQPVEEKRRTILECFHGAVQWSVYSIFYDTQCPLEPIDRAKDTEEVIRDKTIAAKAREDFLAFDRLLRELSTRLYDAMKIHSPQFIEAIRTTMTFHVVATEDAGKVKMISGKTELTDTNERAQVFAACHCCFWMKDYLLELAEVRAPPQKEHPSFHALWQAYTIGQPHESNALEWKPSSKVSNEFTNGVIRLRLSLQQCLSYVG